MTPEPGPAAPIATFRGAPVYRAGHAPEPLLTTGQLRAQRRKVLPDQQPAAWINLPMPYRGADYVPLWHPDDSIALRPVPPAQQAAMTERRTCAACATVHPGIVRGGLVDSLHRWERWCPRCISADRDLHLRTCRRCAAVFEQRDSVHGGGLCLACSGHLDRARPVVRALTDRACPRCTTATATAGEVAAARGTDRYGWWEPRTCEPCQAEEAAEREAARLRGLWQRWSKVRPVRDWAREVLADPRTAVLDTETTGLHDTALIVEIAIYTAAGEKLLDTLVNPGPGESIPAKATAIHGIADADVADAPTLGELLPGLTAALAGRRIVIYNRAYDEARLAHELDRHHRQVTPPRLPLPEGELHPAAAEWIKAQHWDRCAMEEYAVHAGEWDPYWRSYTWQRLNGGHRAGGDCRAVIERLHEMAQTPDPA